MRVRGAKIYVSGVDFRKVLPYIAGKRAWCSYAICTYACAIIFLTGHDIQWIVRVWSLTGQSHRAGHVYIYIPSCFIRTFPPTYTALTFSLCPVGFQVIVGKFIATLLSILLSLLSLKVMQTHFLIGLIVKADMKTSSIS